MGHSLEYEIKHKYFEDSNRDLNSSIINDESFSQESIDWFTLGWSFVDFPAQELVKHGMSSPTDNKTQTSRPGLRLWRRKRIGFMLNAGSGIFPQQHTTGNRDIKRVFGTELGNFDDTITSVDHRFLYAIDFIAEHKSHGLCAKLHVLQ